MHYRIGRKKRNTTHHIYVLMVLALIAISASVGSVWYLSSHSTDTTINQVATTNEEFDPSGTKNNIKISTSLYTMELPANWKQISTNRDSRYNSVQWQMQSDGKNRWIELYTDKLPLDTPFNKIIPVSIKGNEISIDTESDNCAKFTIKTSDANLKVSSKWQDAAFLCDLSNKTDNIVGVSDKVTGVALHYTGITQGEHSYMFVYTDRGIPEDQNPIMTALKSLAPK